MSLGLPSNQLTTNPSGVLENPTFRIFSTAPFDCATVAQRKATPQIGLRQTGPPCVTRGRNFKLLIP